jgi:hypothetical protein
MFDYHTLVEFSRAVRPSPLDRVALEARPISINVRITAVRNLAVEAADNGLLAPENDATWPTAFFGRDRIWGRPLASSRLRKK